LVDLRGNGLLEIEVLAGSEYLDTDRGVADRGRRDDDRVDVLALHELLGRLETCGSGGE
jgi:hypothetical protein